MLVLERVSRPQVVQRLLSRLQQADSEAGLLVLALSPLVVVLEHGAAMTRRALLAENRWGAAGAYSCMPS